MIIRLSIDIHTFEININDQNIISYYHYGLVYFGNKFQKAYNF